jgi:integrase
VNGLGQNNSQIVVCHTGVTVMEKFDMATLRKRLDKWQVQVRRTGSQNLSKTFIKKSDAHSWGIRMEAEVENFSFAPDARQLEKSRLSDLINRYLNEYVPAKKGASAEAFVLKALLRHKIAQVTLSTLSPKHFSEYRDERLTQVKPGTVIRQFVIIQHMLKIARIEWGLPLPNNPVEMIQKPLAGRPRKRRLEQGELETLHDAVTGSRAPYLWPLVELAIETGMRRGEMLKAEWCDLDLQARKLTLYDTKNGEDRTIPLTLRATEVLSNLPRTDDRIFPVTPVAVRHSWERLRKRAGIEDLHFHDLRHEAISRFFEMGLSVPEVALISGHKDFRMLARYTHLRAEDVVGKLK